MNNVEFGFIGAVCTDVCKSNQPYTQIRKPLEKFITIHSKQYCKYNKANNGYSVKSTMSDKKI